jgi:hypothetical protein
MVRGKGQSVGEVMSHVHDTALNYSRLLGWEPCCMVLADGQRDETETQAAQVNKTCCWNM